MKSVGFFRIVKPDSLSFKFSIIILISSSIIVLLALIPQTLQEHRQRSEQISRNIGFIENSYLPAMNKSLFNFDMEQTKVLLNGIIFMDGVDYCELHDDTSLDSPILSAGTLPGKINFIQTYNLEYKTIKGYNTQLGTLILIGNRTEFLITLKKAAITYLTSGLFTVLILTFIVLITFQKLVAKPLSKLANYTKTLDFSNLSSRDILQNKNRKDEIGMVANAIEDMTKRLIVDLKEKEVSEKKLSASNHRFSSVLNSLDTFVIVIDIYTKRVLFSNAPANNILGDMVGKIYTEIVKGKYSSLCKCWDNNPKDIPVLDEEGSFIIKEINNTETDQWFECRIRKIQWSTGEEVYLKIITDITKRKKYSNMIVQSEKMLSLGGLSAGMAHEINNPLAGMMQNAQAISNRLMSNSKANIEAANTAGTNLASIRNFLEERKIFNQLQRIQEAGIRAAEIVKSMLDFSHKGSAKSSQNIAELLDKTVDLAGQDYDLKKDFDFRNINIVRKYEENLPLIVCDSAKIQQVFLNILKNGAQAMTHSILRQAHHDAGSGTAHSASSGTEKLHFILSIKQESERIKIEITNTGSGISREIQNRIFEPFYTTKPEGIGTGLGLSVSYFIITEIHNGEIKVESDGISWVKFIILLPIS